MSQMIFLTLKKLDIIIFCLPTPLKKNRPDLSYIKITLQKIKNIYKKINYLF